MTPLTSLTPVDTTIHPKHRLRRSVVKSVEDTIVLEDRYVRVYPRHHVYFEYIARCRGQNRFLNVCNLLISKSETWLVDCINYCINTHDGSLIWLEERRFLSSFLLRFPALSTKTALPNGLKFYIPILSNHLNFV